MRCDIFGSGPCGAEKMCISCPTGICLVPGSIAGFAKHKVLHLPVFQNHFGAMGNSLRILTWKSLNIGGHLWHRQWVLAALSPGQRVSKEFGRGTRTQAKQAKEKAGGKKYWKNEERQENQFGIDRTREKETCQRGTTKEEVLLEDS